MDLDGQISSPGDSAKSNSSSHCSIVAKPIQLLLMAIDHPRVLPPLEDLIIPGPSKLIPKIHQEFWLTTWLVSAILQSRWFIGGGLSEQACTLLLASWREKNNRSYQSAWKIWCGWCSARGMDPLNSHLNALLEFLAHRFQQGKSYRSLNVYCSAISSTFPQINDIPVG